MPATFDPGTLRHRVTWQTLDQSAVDALNQPVDTWTSVGTFWARVEPLTGMELYNARQLKATTGYKITMRNVGALKPSDRLLFEGTGRVFGLDQVYRVDERNAYLSIHASELKSPQ